MDERIALWLLERTDPSVRYHTIIGILGRYRDDPEVEEARSRIMDSDPVRSILSRQNPDGSWGKPDRMYTDKYTGTLWNLLILAELGADGNDPRIRKACEFVLENSQDKESGGFSMHTVSKSGGGRHSEVIPCLTGNMVYSLIKFGMMEDPRVQKGIEWMTRYQRFDDGDRPPLKGWPYDKAVMCFGKHTCHMGAVKALKALAEIPEEERSDGVRSTIDAGTEYILKHRIFKSSRDPSKVPKPGWTKFGFPLMYQTDTLEIMGILSKLKVRDERMEEAYELIGSKKGSDGRWILENSFNGKTLVDIEKKSDPSKWITLKALSILNSKN
jgi:hypothetical protein